MRAAALALCLVFALGARASSSDQSVASSVSVPVSVQNVPISEGPVPPQVQPVHVQPPHSAISGVEPAVVVPQSIQPQPVASHYSPAGIVQVVGVSNGPPVGVKPSGVSGVKPVEQYGQPESAAIPAHYKPFGSWGLYIGGNPADGYYTNYYKSLSSSVEKQQQQGVGGNDKSSVSSVAAFNPILKQASSSPYQGADYYPFSYSAQDFSANVPLVPQMFGDSVDSAAPGSSVVGSSMSSPPSVGVISSQSSSYIPNGPMFAPSGPPSYIPEAYATKRVGGTKSVVSQQREVQAPTKSAVKSQAAVYYATPVSGAVQSIAHHQYQPQVVAYPVPVGSQIVGSQVGVDGAFYPYGVHAFTKYAVKPTVVGAEQYVYQSAPSIYNPAQLSVVQPSSYKYVQHGYYSPSYSQSGVAPINSAVGGYFAYPASQLHYSNGLVVPSSGSIGSASVHHGGYESVPSPASSFEEDDKLVKPVHKS